MASLIINGRSASVDQSEFMRFHGNSVFTTFRTLNGEPAMWELHWQRLVEHAIFFSFAIPRHDEIYGFIKSLLHREAIDQKIRIIIGSDAYCITAEPFVRPESSIYDGVRVIISTFMVHPQLARFKTANSLPYLLAKREADAGQTFEALMLDQNGYVVDGSRTSILMIADDVLIALEGGLRGCMREVVLGYAADRGFMVKRAALKQTEFTGQLLLTNSLIGVVPVNEARSDMAKEIIDRFRMDQSNTAYRL